MKAALRWFTCLLLAAAPVAAQQSSTVQNIEMRVRLTWSDHHSFKDDAAPSGGSTQDNKTQMPGRQYQGNSASNLLIRIRVLNEDGSTVAEASPNGEGEARFVVPGQIVNGMQRLPYSYRITVLGSEIEESTVDNVTPARGDSMVNIVLRRKGEKATTGGGIVSATSLRIPGKAAKELERGGKALADGKLPDARAHFEKAVELYPAYDEAYNGLGVTLMKSGNATAGKQAFEKAIAVNSSFAPAYVNLARIAGQDKEYGVAVQHLKRSLAVEPLNVEALAMLCQYSFLDGKLEDVPAISNKLHSLPHDGLGLCHYAAANALEQRLNYDGAIVEYTVFIKEAPASTLVPKAKEAIQRLREQSNIPASQ